MTMASDSARQLARTKKASENATTADLATLKELHGELNKVGRLGNLPGQATLTKKAIKYCNKALERAETDCICPGNREVNDRRVPPRWLCPACERAKAILNIFIQIETLSVRRAGIEESLFRDIIRARSGSSEDNGGAILSFAGILKAYNESKAAAAQQLPPVDVEAKVAFVG